MNKIIFGFQCLKELRAIIEDQNQFLTEEQQQFFDLHNLLWSRMGKTTQLQFGELHIDYQYVLGSSRTCYTNNAGLDEGHFMITHGRQRMTISSYHERYKDTTIVMIHNSYIVVEASSNKALEMLPMMLRLAL